MKKAKRRVPLKSIDIVRRGGGPEEEIECIIAPLCWLVLYYYYLRMSFRYLLLYDKRVVTVVDMCVCCV